MKMEEKDFEPAGLIPRSIIRTVERFQQQLRPETIALGIQEFRISRYQVRVSVRYFFILLLLPISLNWGAKNLIIKPLVGYFWNTHRTSLFLNNYQAERAFQEMRDFESQLFFEMLISTPESPSGFNNNISNTKSSLLTLNSTSLISTAENKKTNQNHNNTSQNKFCLCEANPIQLQCFGNTKLGLSNFEGNSVTLKTKGSNEKKIIEEPITKSKYYITSKVNFENPSLVFTKQIPNRQPLAPIDTQYPVWNSITNGNKNISGLDNGQNSCGVEGSTKDYESINGSNFNSELEIQDLNSNFQGTKTSFAALFQKKTLLLAEIYNQQSITALSNMFGDCVMIVSTILLIRWNAPQFTILKSFLIESFYSFNDAIKCFYIILITDFLVGFHSPRGWEIAMEMLLRHLGLPEDEEFILLFVGTFPVFLDTAFKYWIFRYLNKISPSTVATYHSMIE